MPKPVVEECNVLGLFQTRMPRFSQLFFHESLEHEVALKFGRSSRPSASFLAAKRYLRSGTRLESKCGLSDVWYGYVESNWRLFEDPEMSFSFTPAPPRPHSVLSNDDSHIMCGVFDWWKQHGRSEPEWEAPAATFSAREACGPQLVAHEEALSGGTEECVDGEPGDHQDSLNGDAGDGTKEVEEGETRGKFNDVGESWFSPPAPSFDRALFKAMDKFESAPEADWYIPSSIPEEQELHLGPGLLKAVGFVNCVGRAPDAEVPECEVPMEGVEPSQPTEGQITDVSDGEGEDEEPTDPREREHTTEGG